MNELKVDLTSVYGIVGAVMLGWLVIRCTVVRWIKMAMTGGAPKGEEEPAWDPGTGVPL